MTGWDGARCCHFIEWWIIGEVLDGVGWGAFCGRLTVECSQDWWRLLDVWWLAPLIPRELAPVSWFVLCVVRARESNKISSRPVCVCVSCSSRCEG